MVLDSAQARKKIESVTDLPTLPSVANQIIAMANSPRTNAADVGKMIEQDQALTAKVLKLVNSSFYGFPGQIKSIQHAVVIIGFNKVKNVVVTASVFDLSKGRDANRLDLPRFWQHSLGTAIGAQVVATTIGGGLSPEDAFVGGLVHDLGKLIMDQFLPKEYAPVFDHITENPCLIMTAEKEILGFQHSLVGSWIAERWKLPPALHNAIRYHHKPMQAREDREMAISVHIGDILARALCIGDPGDRRIPEIDQTLWQQCEFKQSDLDGWVQSLIKELRKAEEFFQMIEK